MKELCRLLILVSLGGALCLTGCLSGRGPEALDYLDSDDLYLALISQAVHCQQQGDLLGAIAAYRRALRLNPESALLHMELAHSYYLLGNDTLAVHFAKRAVKLEPDEADYRLVLGNAYILAKELDLAAAQYQQAYRLRPADDVLQTLAGLYEAQNLLDSAIVLYQRRLEQRDSPSFRLQLASLLARGRRWPQALEHYRLLVQADPSSAKNLTALGGLFQIIGQNDSALHYLTLAEQLEPGNIALKTHIFNLLLETKDYRSAAQQAKDILEADPDNRALRQQWARLCLHLGDSTQAEAIYRYLLEQDSSHTEALYQVGLISLGRREYPPARDCFRRLINQIPHFYEGWHYLGQAYLGLGSTDSARQAFEQSRRRGHRLDPDYQTALAYAALDRFQEALPFYQKIYHKRKKEVPFLFGYGAALERSGHYQPAVEIFRQLLRRDPDHASALNYLGYMFAERGQNLAEAESLIARALAIEPNNPYFIDSMGWVYYMTGRIDQAVEELERAVSLLPNDATLRDHLGDAYQARGQNEMAKDQWQKALELEPNKSGLKEKIDALKPHQ